MTQVTKLDYRVIQDTLSSVDCARSLTVSLLLKYGEYNQIVSLSFNPFDYNDLESARDALFATELLRKHEDLPTNIDKSLVSYKSFVAAETVCKQINETLPGNSSHVAQRFAAQRKIERVLGSFCADEWFKLAGWGPGVTLTLRGSDATHTNKFTHQCEVTQPLYQLLKPLWAHQFSHWQLSAREYEGNRVIFVPKNAKTDRTIAVEPSLNLYFQKGVGAMIRNRLYRSGVDLKDQSRNRTLARLGSKDNSLTTVDFSAASDTISCATVRELISNENWYKVLEILRSPRGLDPMNDAIFEYEKFSSMGNGYTFELESLIFWALALACVPEDHPQRSLVSVYGDDVIIPTDCYELYAELCSTCGFTVNASKSFSSSYYRESCGGHYWNGQDITPVYCRRSFTVKGELMRFHNRLVEYSAKTIATGFRDKRFRRVINFLSGRSDVTCYVPMGFGDCGLIKSFDDATPSRNRHYQTGFNGLQWIQIPKKIISYGPGVHLVHLSRLRENESVGMVANSYYFPPLPMGNEVVVPRAGKYRYKKAYFPVWPSLGPWI